jgi:Transposase
LRKTAFTEEQITYTLRQAEAGTAVGEICRKLGISQQAFYRWKEKFAGMGVAKLRRIRRLLVPEVMALGSVVLNNAIGGVNVMAGGDWRATGRILNTVSRSLTIEDGPPLIVDRLLGAGFSEDEDRRWR